MESEENQKPENQQTENRETKSSETNQTDSQESVARELMFKILSDVGCQPTKTEGGSIEVQYQGENFLMECEREFVRKYPPDTSIFRGTYWGYY